jgi:hypothetical protein
MIKNEVSTMSKSTTKSDTSKPATSSASPSDTSSTFSLVLGQNIKQKAEIIKKALCGFASKGNIDDVKEYITKNENVIREVYDEYGGGSEYLLAAYHDTHISNLKFALEYQRCLESKIAGDILFLDE